MNAENGYKCYARGNDCHVLHKNTSYLFMSDSPQEIEKLNSAEARRFGNYVIFAVSDSIDKNYIFSKAEELLKK